MSPNRHPANPVIIGNSVFEPSPNYHPNRHLDDYEPSPPKRVRVTKDHLWRALFIVLGGVTVWVQVTFVWATLPVGDTALKVSPILISVSLALSLVVVEHHWRRGEWPKAGLWFIAFSGLLVVNALTTLTRVADVRAVKAATSVKVGSVQADARRALDRATAHEDEARENMARYCDEVATSTSVETTPINKRKATTTSKSVTMIDPRCQSWTEQYSAATQLSSEARLAVANATVSGSPDGISAAAKSINGVTGWPEVTVDHAIDFVQPCALDVLAMVCFLTAFSTRPSSAPRPARMTPRLAVVARNAPSGFSGGGVAKGLSQADVNALVGRWLADNQLPVNDGMQPALDKLIEWSHLDREAVSLVTFARALTVHGVERRSLHGRKVISRPKLPR